MMRDREISCRESNRKDQSVQAIVRTALLPLLVCVSYVAIVLGCITSITLRNRSNLEISNTYKCRTIKPTTDCLLQPVGESTVG